MGIKPSISLWLCAMLSAFACSNAASAADDLLINKHQKALGASCQTCHAENPPSKKVPDDKCISCHGDRAALGARSKSKPNPHSNHVDELYCADCHHVHKPSEFYCQQCHDDFNLKVP